MLFIWLGSHNVPGSSPLHRISFYTLCSKATALEVQLAVTASFVCSWKNILIHYAWIFFSVSDNTGSSWNSVSKCCRNVQQDKNIHCPWWIGRNYLQHYFYFPKLRLNVNYSQPRRIWWDLIGFMNMFIGAILPKNCSWMKLLARTGRTQMSRMSIAPQLRNCGYKFLSVNLQCWWMGHFANPEERDVWFNWNGQKGLVPELQEGRWAI